MRQPKECVQLLKATNFVSHELKTYCELVAYNEQGLLLCWNFIMSSPEPLPNKKLKDEDNK